jgi:hypothetical protein
MLKTHKSQRSQDENQNKFSPGDRPLHDKCYPYLNEFSELISGVSIDALKYKLMTYQERLMAEAMWAANNYGGSTANCAKQLKEVYGPRWYKVTSVEEHMEPVRTYYEYVLILSHQNQWNRRQNLAKLIEAKSSEV